MRTWCLCGDMMRTCLPTRRGEEERKRTVPRTEPLSWLIARGPHGADANCPISPGSAGDASSCRRRSSMKQWLEVTAAFCPVRPYIVTTMPARFSALRSVVAGLSRPQGESRASVSWTFPVPPNATIGLPVRYASSVFRMPAMSPTMTEGGIANWKKAEGEAFAAGDVLLEIETDKATIDVEAQDDGVMGKILTQAGENKVPVGQVIAILAEEGDDLASIEVPSDLAPEGSTPAPSTSASAAETKDSGAKESASASSSNPGNNEAKSSGGEHHHEKITHSKPLFPSVYRL